MGAMAAMARQSKIGRVRCGAVIQAALARPMPMTMAMEPVRIGGRMRSIHFLPR